MTNSPEVSRWYVAELTEEVALEADPLQVIHRKTRVIFADSAEDAYQKALSMISEQEKSCSGRDYLPVRRRFWRLRELNLPNEDLDRGRIRSKEQTGMTPGGHSTGLSPDQQCALLMSLKCGALRN